MHHMDLAEFKATLSEPHPPPGWSPMLVALWQDGRGDWDAAHRTIQDHEDRDGSWIHAYLHRKEGDDANASYWYRRAGQPVPQVSLEAEWESLVRTFLARP